MRLMNWLHDRSFSAGLTGNKNYNMTDFPSSVCGAFSKQSVERAEAKRPRKTLSKRCDKQYTRRTNCLNKT